MPLFDQASNNEGLISKALSAEKLILLTDVDGVLDIEEKLLSFLKKSEIDTLVKNKTISGGMIPKVDCCLDALEGGVKETHIINGKIPHAVLLEIFTDSGIGTKITGGV